MILAGALPAATPLIQLSPTLYHTEHCLFVIDASVTWNSPTTAYNDVYASPFSRLNNAYDALQANFPATYFSICYMANTGASNTPNYIDRTDKGTGINMPAPGGAPNTFATTDFCRYNLVGSVYTPALAVYDHELGHAWGARAFYNLSPPTLSNGHWVTHSTVDCQMGSGYSADGGLTVNKLYGDPVNGFRWQRMDSLQSNDYQTFSEQSLYLLGVRERWPTSYVLNNPVYNSDRTATYSSVDAFDHAAMVAAYGARNPDYTVSPKQFKLGFVYIARDLSEVNSVCQAVEQSANQFCNGENFDTTTYRFQTPFLSNTKFRASVDGRLADLDGNATPTLTVTDTYVTSTDGSATINFVSADSDGPTPAVSMVPATACCTVAGSTVQVSGLPDGVHFFTLKAADAGGKKAYGHFVIEVQRPTVALTVTSQPVPQTVTAGTNASFSVAASGTPASYTYQWYRKSAFESSWNPLADNSTYAGTATASLTVAGLPTLNRSEFLCLVSNVAGTVTSQSALLVVNETTPVLSAQPPNRSVVSGNYATYSVSAAGSATTYGYYYYQWQRLPAGGGTWADLSSGGGYNYTTSATMSVLTNPTMSGDQFRCIVSNTSGSTTSNAGSLTVGTLPAITVQPATPVTVSAGQGTTFSITATGSAPLAYQWSLYGVAITGATSSSLTITNAQAADAGAYTVDVTNAFGLARSNVASLTVSAASPSISNQPQSQAVTAGQGATFSVTATGTNPFSYQWKNGGVSIVGATASTLTLGSVQNSDAGSYTVVVTNSAGSTTSNAAVLTVNSAPTITAHPLSQAAVVGADITLTVAAGGTPAPTYQWKKDGVAISGATGSSLSLSTVQFGDAGSYTVDVTNLAGSATSNAAVITVHSVPMITTQPVTQTTAVGFSITLTVAASGTPSPTYQWKKDGAVIGGATASSMTLVNIQNSDAGSYTVVVTNSAGSVGSNAAVLTVVSAAIAPDTAVITFTVE